ncbi:MAG TPA: hypothetical protein DD435_06965 [Cyanobacteria bacterium UBA8530]|nr:hypothetical protein [Cyanobacteria bacterium UBA8530]
MIQAASGRGVTRGASSVFNHGVSMASLAEGQSKRFDLGKLECLGADILHDEREALQAEPDTK